MSLANLHKLDLMSDVNKTVSNMLDEYATMTRFINSSPELLHEYEKYKILEILHDKYGKR